MEIKNKLHVSLALKAASLAVLLGVIISLLQVSYDLYNERDKNEQQIFQILNSVKKSAAEAAYELDPQYSLRVVEGVLEYDAISYAALYDDFNTPIAEQSKPNARVESSALSNWIVGDKHRFELSLNDERTDQQVGRLEVLVDPEALADSFLNRAGVIIVSGLVRNIALTLILVLIFYLLLTRPLVTTIRELNDSVNAEGEQREIGSVFAERDDELGKLVKVFNQLLEQQQHSKARLEQLQSYLSSVIESMPSVLIGVDEDGVVTQWNREAERVSCKSAEDALGEKLIKVFPGLTTEIDLARQAIRSGEPQLLQKHTNTEMGDPRIVDIAVYPLDLEDKKGAVIRWDDVTDQSKMEEVIIQSEKMLSLGGLAAGMAHEINNPLAGILQNAQVLRNRISPALQANLHKADQCGTDMEAVQRYMEQREIPLIVESIVEAGKRASALVNNMLSFSKKGGGRKVPENFVNLIDKTIELVMNDYDLTKRFDFRKIQIIRDLEPAMPEVVCEASKIQQVILNILKNGAQAMTEAQIPEPVFILRLHREGDNAVLEVSDNGPGVSEAVKNRIFEPFFTTKHSGTGLGLSVAYFIVAEDHHGTLSVESSPGKGAKFILSLPIDGVGQTLQGEIA